MSIKTKNDDDFFEKHRILFSKEQNEEIKKECNDDIDEFFRKTDRWVNAQSPNGDLILR